MKELFLKYIGLIAGLIVIGFMVWYFSGIVTYIAVALLLSFMGSPLARRLGKVHIGKYRLPKAVCASITLLVMIMIFGIFVLIVVPLIIQQANVIATIDVEKLVAHYQEPMERLNEFLIQYNVLGSEETIANYIENQITSLMDLTKFTNFFANLVSATGSVFMGTFIILFLTFYFLLDENLVKNFILLLTPDEHMQSIEHVLHDSKILLVRYFHGIMLEIVIMMTLESTGLLMFGVPNAILIGFLGGLMNVIPYLGPIIGASIGIILVTLSELSLGNYDMVLFGIFSVVAVFAGANLIDNFILQPQIYSRRVKAHPVEVFLVIIVGGKVAGIAGMILAIPTYTVFKVIAREFAQRMKLVKFLTSKM
ncbi:MAG: AI-2E family transporter [bacterium]